MGNSFLSRLFRWSASAGAESRRFGNYHITKIIHEGEKAFVYQARCPEDDSLVAIKVYKPEYNRTARRLRKRYHLRTEGEMGLAINPPSGVPLADFPIVRTLSHGHEFGDSARCYFVVLEFVNGFNLKHMIGCAHPFLREKRMEIARTVGRALAIIHERGFVHRDIGSDNILVQRDGRAKLIDLGFMAPVGIQFKEKSGTPSYMSPEQFQAKVLTPPSDIYSLGVVLFEMFAGQLPFQSAYNAHNPDLVMRRASDLMHKHLRDQPELPEEMTKELPPGMDRIILRCLEKTPEKRYPTMRHLLAELHQVQESGAGGETASGAEL